MYLFCSVINIDSMEMLETNFEVLEYAGLMDIDLCIVLTLLMFVHNAGCI